MGHGGQLTNLIILRSRIFLNNPRPLTKKKLLSNEDFIEQKVSS